VLDGDPSARTRGAVPWTLGLSGGLLGSSLDRRGRPLTRSCMWARHKKRTRSTSSPAVPPRLHRRHDRGHGLATPGHAVTCSRDIEPIGGSALATAAEGTRPQIARPFLAPAAASFGIRRWYEARWLLRRASSVDSSPLEVRRTPPAVCFTGETRDISYTESKSRVGVSILCRNDFPDGVCSRC
jgi:hypothetical protein